MKSLTTTQVILRIVIIISLAEFFIMVLLGIIPIKINIYLEAALDLTLLVILTTPLIDIWVVSPFVTARDNALEKIRLLAHTDPLTDLANRRLLTIHLEKLISGTVRHKIRGAVLLIDLDGFKHINDVHGHDAGDKVLVEVAKRLRSNTRPEDVVGRLGGDELVILIHNLDANERIAHDVALSVAEKLLDSIDKPINFKGTTLNVSASVGVFILGLENIDTESAIRAADKAMYQAKQAGGGSIVFSEK